MLFGSARDWHHFRIFKLTASGRKKLHLSHAKEYGWLFDIGDDNPTQLFRACFINHDIRIPIDQPGLAGWLIWVGRLAPNTRLVQLQHLAGRFEPLAFQQLLLTAASGSADIFWGGSHIEDITGGTRLSQKKTLSQKNTIYYLALTM